MDRVNKITADCFNAVAQLRELDFPTTAPDSIHAQFCRYLDEARERAREEGMSERDADDVVYALAALIDSVALSKPEPVHGHWVARPLQLQYFNEFEAGEGFFKRLDELRRDGRRREVLRVYYLCLLFGFQGRYSMGAGELELMKMVESLRPEVERSVESADPLSPAGDPPDEPLMRGSGRNLLMWIALGVFAAAIAVFIGLRVSLDRQVADIASRVEELRR
jgi:type VI secretion system protein ImpK